MSGGGSRSRVASTVTLARLVEIAILAVTGFTALVLLLFSGAHWFWKIIGVPVMGSLAALLIYGVLLEPPRPREVPTKPDERDECDPYEQNLDAKIGRYRKTRSLLTRRKAEAADDDEVRLIEHLEQQERERFLEDRR